LARLGRRHERWIEILRRTVLVLLRFLSAPVWRCQSTARNAAHDFCAQNQSTNDLA
jgi:hypothetical protein